MRAADAEQTCVSARFFHLLPIKPPIDRVLGNILFAPLEENPPHCDGGQLAWPPPAVTVWQHWPAIGSAGGRIPRVFNDLRRRSSLKPDALLRQQGASTGDGHERGPQHRIVKEPPGAPAWPHRSRDD